MSFGYIYIYSGTPLAQPPTGRHSVARVAGLGWSRHTSIPKGFMSYRDHFISAILSLTENHTTEKVDVGSTNSRRVNSMSLLRHIGTYQCSHF